MIQSPRLLAVLLVLPWLQAVAQDTPSPGYWYSSNGTLVRTGFGHCWRTAQWSPENALRACDPQLFREPEAAEPPAAEPAAPSPDPAPVREAVAAFNMAPVLFGFDSSSLEAAQDARLQHLAMHLRHHPGVQLTLVGHTDSRGSAHYNMKLGLKRAQAVAERLVELGVDRARIRAISAGEHQPVADNATEQGRAANRRVEFVLEH